MKKIIDTSGLSCPQPVILTKKALKEPPNTTIQVLVDNETAKKNVLRFLTFSGITDVEVSTENSLMEINFSVPSENTNGSHKKSSSDKQKTFSKSSASSKQGTISKDIEIEQSSNFTAVCDIPVTTGKTYLISSSVFGEGEEKLGNLLMKGFLYSLTQLDEIPKAVIFINSGVFLTTTDNSDLIENLKDLENKGTDIVSCGTCLDYYNIKDSLKVGYISNMYSIVEMISNETKLIRI
ncbi:MAG: sulfurtransferase-like selenium metabolism protein YedF [Spirochaetia bacterium]|nr:sulfurtransferase-like selenium metabolism protein YedF [Spirochaetia bacterium]MCF7946481.1 sulfurtransferase-like selenium metabolism protein YedF [Spirochaetia bacterium]